MSSAFSSPPRATATATPTATATATSSIHHAASSLGHHRPSTPSSWSRSTHRCCTAAALPHWRLRFASSPCASRCDAPTAAAVAAAAAAAARVTCLLLLSDGNGLHRGVSTCRLPPLAQGKRR
ncbi:hypothetical protein TcWFU_006932 [Taenia crassiceps]|uniref:Uncharacterized protein n=1 Tax=Taenia crassiceps TaxID=6207 RepID=A0ABR4QES9_9CEST